jgi:tetratricopeptide (TPR) repeat protein
MATTSTTTTAATPGHVPWRLWTLLAVAILGVASVVWWRYRVSRPEYRLARGDEAIQANDWEQVDSLVEKLEAAGRADEAHLLRGKAYLARRRPDLALTQFDTIRENSPHYLVATAQAGRCLLELGARREAFQVFSFLAERDPDHIDAHRGLAAIAYDLGQLDQAVEHLEVVARLDANDSRPFRLIGLIYKDLGQREKADAAYGEALRRGLSPALEKEVRKERAENLVELHRYADAIAVLDALPVEDERTTAARADALRGAGRAREAVALLDRELKRFPAGALFRIRGQLSLDAQDYPVAITHLERAAELLPRDYRSHFLLSQAYAGAHRADDARRETARAEELRQTLDQITSLSKRAMERPWDAAVRLQLAELSDRLGMSEVAQGWRTAAEACQGKGRSVTGPSVGTSR